MKRIVPNLVVLGLAALVAWSCFTTSETAPPEMTDAEFAQMEAEVTQAIAERWVGFWEATQAQDYDVWASYWTSDTRVLQPGVDLSGSAWFDYGREFFDSGMQWHTFDVGSFEVFVHGNAAYQLGQYDETVTLGTGEPTEWHEYLFVRWLKGDDGMWRISRILTAPRDAPAEG